ncbi:late embryogenesis abundant hydroxyproline-rich glycoprotein [Trifolium pratense]|uniref:Late embryogenesis abundant hydroxyproline-rich glycoprotein n=2 Tax=Trifolium TaxID=3898 RepID=A0A2K3JL44_TRIPR|nr:late embryogenesis abundant hydroxyproline-rich glycoprotein [Trifolium pratense]
MADRIHPNTLPVSDDSQTTSSQKPALASNTAPAPSPPPGTYIIQVPKDQTYRHPPPENAQRYANYTRRKTRRNRCCCCLCWLIGILFILLVLAAIAAGVFYLIFRPESPHYSIDRISVKGMNLNSSVISPEFDVSVKADNGNNKIGIYYETDSTVEIFYKDAVLCNGVLPVFYQPSNNVTVFQTVLKGNGIELARSDRRTLVNAVAKRNVPLSLKLRAPVKIKVGSVKTWKIRVKVDCDVTVDQLTAQAKIVNKDCNYGLDLWL